MFQTDTDSNTFCFNLNARSHQIAVDITSGVTRCKDDGSEEGSFTGTNPVINGCRHRFYTDDTLFCLRQRCRGRFHDESRHLRLEVHLTATAQDSVAHILNDLRQPVRSDMGMSVGKNSRRSPMLTEHIKNFLHRATFLRTGVELAV